MNDRLEEIVMSDYAVVIFKCKGDHRVTGYGETLAEALRQAVDEAIAKYGHSCLECAKLRAFA